MAVLKPQPLPCPKCGSATHVSLTGRGLINWMELRPGCKCYPSIKSESYWINRDDHVQLAEKAYRGLVEGWNKVVEDAGIKEAT
jgi:hypothetical protein